MARPAWTYASETGKWPDAGLFCTIRQKGMSGRRQEGPHFCPERSFRGQGRQRIRKRHSFSCKNAFFPSRSPACMQVRCSRQKLFQRCPFPRRTGHGFGPEAACAEAYGERQRRTERAPYRFGRRACLICESSDALARNKRAPDMARAPDTCRKGRISRGPRGIRFP